MRTANLEQITHALAPLGCYDATVSDQIQSVKSRYDEPWRHHHNFEHPLEMFGVLLDHKDLVRCVGAVGWSIMYHDAIYDPTADHGRNEELSARLAERELPSIVGHKITDLVALYTRETAAHSAAGDDRDLDLFLDIDLTVLGSDPARYARYMTDIRHEYAHVPDDTYQRARIGILEGLARRVESRGLFRTPELAEIYERQAQENIAAEIDMLRPQDTALEKAG